MTTTPHRIARRPERGPRQWQPVQPYTLVGWERERIAIVAGKPLPRWHEPLPTTSVLRARLIAKREREERT